jgi:HTH-type transcriptional regulator, competence development regulator
MMDFGSYIRQLREQRREVNRRYSVRQTAQRIGVEPAYLSKIERGDVSPPSEETIRRLAADLGEDVDLLLALAGKVSSDLRDVIIQRPILFAELIRGLSDVPDEILTELVGRVRNGEW